MVWNLKRSPKSESNSSDDFTYRPLRDADEIRLLNIPPRNNAAGRTIHLNLDHFRLSTKPLYTAISWMWGAPGKSDRMSVGGGNLTIQHDLKRFIEQLQEDDQPRKVWIDAVCIDQDNIDERNHQVQMMGQIYSNANYVIACLTTERRNQRKHLKASAEQLHKGLGQPDYFLNTAEYALFFRNPYFLRRWIIQEIAQAKALYFSCEGYQLQKNILGDSIHGLRLRTEPSSLESRAVQLCQSQTRYPMPLEELLYEHEYALCSDFHDKVYALLSLTDQAKLHLKVDYDLTESSLMLSVLNVCYTYENLSVFRVLSFMCFLQGHLRVDKKTLRENITNLNTPRLDYLFTERATNHGTVETLEYSADIEEAALDIRRNLPSLSTRHPLPCIPVGGMDPGGMEIPPTLIFDEHHAIGTQLPPILEIPGIDQCLFTLAANDPRASASTLDLPHVGFASTNVMVGDEIWQFERTPVAVVARKIADGYVLVGRAFLVRDIKSRERWSRDKVENELIWVKDSHQHQQTTPNINLDWKGLHELMTWVNLD